MEKVATLDEKSLKTVHIQADGNIRSAWMLMMARAMGYTGKRLRLVQWIADHADDDGYLHMAQRAIAKQSGISTATVARVMGQLQDGDTPCIIRTDGGYQINPEIMRRNPGGSLPGIVLDEPGRNRETSGQKNILAVPISQETKDNIIKLFLLDEKLKGSEPFLACRASDDPKLGNYYIVVASEHDGSEVKVMRYDEICNRITTLHDSMFSKSIKFWDIEKDRAKFDDFWGMIFRHIKSVGGNRSDGALNIYKNTGTDLSEGYTNELKKKAMEKKEAREKGEEGRKMVAYSTACSLEDITDDIMPYFMMLLGESHIEEVEYTDRFFHHEKLTCRTVQSSCEFRKRAMRELGISYQEYYDLLHKLYSVGAIDYVDCHGKYRIMASPPDGYSGFVKCHMKLKSIEEERQIKQTTTKEAERENKICRNLRTGQFLSGAKRVKLSGNYAIKSFRIGGHRRRG